jgi:hypothetical protein
MNILWNTGCNKSMADHMEEREKALFSPMERLIMEHLRKSDDGFIAVNETGLYEQNVHELYAAISHLEELHIIRKRNCEAEAYEWYDKTVLLKMLH